ncbi:MAG: hypothetical protein K6T87_03615 [Roseiflexus sp.]|jgi:hypothetical protein|uniref:hypothetical protein n=1 Tax=Roseiflexus sp. TaxID=2562120 RepID=UPI0025FCC5A3|nr:hypothetical protein [Roseiflexus sp.]MCL6539670.1 hypothetical protein [Roseiflexus sp.]
MSASLKSPATLFVLGVFLIMTVVLPAPRPVSASSVLYAAPTATGSADVPRGRTPAPCKRR